MSKRLKEFKIDHQMLNLYEDSDDEHIMPQEEIVFESQNAINSESKNIKNSTELQ